MNGEIVAGFPDLWLWLVFVIIGLLLVLLELVVGVETGLDLVFIGSAFVLGGLITWPSNSWVLSLIVTSLILVAYLVIGRRYVHRWTVVKGERTNIDAIVGRRGVVLKSIARNVDGRVRLGNERWQARAEEDIGEGDEIVVTNVTGSTLIVEKHKGGG
ncbi:MAG: NfeD family protein [Dehalococcoidales bacterium]|jgi:membrane protein implicated in regulation of membrane protease activity|nr:NfeD family protein [Dehalococcoidales bacterium]